MFTATSNKRKLLQGASALDPWISLGHGSGCNGADGDDNADSGDHAWVDALIRDDKSRTAMTQPVRRMTSTTRRPLVPM
jgi:hypothetical protein